MTDHSLLRSSQFCTIYPALATVTEQQKLQLRHGDEHILHILSDNTVESVDAELMQFYWENQGGNQWATVADHRIFRMCLTCLTAKRHIVTNIRIAPVVGVVTTELGSFSAIPCDTVYPEFSGTQAFLDPTPVGHDAGYTMFMDPVEVMIRERLELNLARYARIAWSSALGVEPNARFVHTPGSATIWIQATRDIRAGEIIWVSPPTNMRFGMNPVTMFWNPPYPSGTHACHIPEYWEHIIVECLPDDPTLPAYNAQHLSVFCTIHSDVPDTAVVDSRRYGLVGKYVAWAVQNQTFQIIFDLQFWAKVYELRLFFVSAVSKLMRLFIEFFLIILRLLAIFLKVANNWVWTKVSITIAYRWSFASHFWCWICLRRCRRWSEACIFCYRQFK